MTTFTLMSTLDSQSSESLQNQLCCVNLCAQIRFDHLNTWQLRLTSFTTPRITQALGPPPVSQVLASTRKNKRKTTKKKESLSSSSLSDGSV